MKITYVFSLIILLTTSSASAAKMVCVLKESASPQNYSAVKVDLSQSSEDYYNDDNGINIGNESYSFGLQVESKGKIVTVNAVFMENNHVQDEVSSGAWNFDISKAKFGVPVLQEDMNKDDGEKLMDFLCYYYK